jgi:hypothetical protein
MAVITVVNAAVTAVAVLAVLFADHAAERGVATVIAVIAAALTVTGFRERTQVV